MEDTDFLREIPEKAFCLKVNEHEVIARPESLEEMRSSLLKAPLQVFSFHLRENKNDFADWVENVICDTKLAKKLRKVKLIDTKDARRQIIEALKDRINELKAKKILKEKIEKLSKIPSERKLRKKRKKSLLERALEKRKEKSI